MDDLIFSLDDLNFAQSVVKESLELLSSRKFSLVKWSSNHDAVVVLSKIDKEKLCSDIRDIDLSVQHPEELPFANILGCI